MSSSASTSEHDALNDGDIIESPRATNYTSKVNTSRLSIIRMPNALSELSLISDLEVHCFSFFRHNTVPRMATYFENCIWRIDLQNAALAIHNPALFKTVIALGAVHRRFCYGISREAFEYCAHAARLYNNAVLSLESLKNQGGVGNQGIISACEALLGIFQAFQADPETSSRHIRSGVHAAVGKPLRLLHSEAWHYANPSPPRVICGMMYELYCRASELFGEPALTRLPDYDSHHYGFPMPAEFESLRDMKNHLFSMVEEVWRRHRWDEDSSNRRAFLELYEDRLHDWACACIRSLKSSVIIESPEIKAFNLLSLTQSALCVSIQGNMLTTNRRDMRRIPHLPILTNGSDDLSEAAASLCEAVDQMRSVDNADLSHVKSVFEQTMIKHKIFCFERYSMQTSDSRVDEMLNLWTIGKQVSEAEEEAVVEAIRDIIPPTATHVDISDIWCEKRKLAVRYFEPNPNGAYRWIQQFWSF